MTIVYEYPESRRKVLNATGESMSRVDAEALGYTVAPYIDLVGLSSRIATRHAEHADLAVLPPFGLVVAAGTAKAMGFAVSTANSAPRADAKPSTTDPCAVWRAAIIKLPEVANRPSATAELLTTQTPETLTVDAARAFLRGLPVESAEHSEERTMNTHIDPRADRLAQINDAAAAFNKSRGHAAKASTAITPAAVSTESPEKLKRLAEIRQTMLIKNGQDRSQEAKALRLAFEAHNRMGTPFAQALAQSGFDASILTKHAR